MKSSGILAALALLTAGAASAQDAQSTQATQVAAKSEKKICRVEQMTGSLINRQRICMTQEGWDRLAEKSRQEVGSLERDANQRTINTQAANSFQNPGR
jgi:hypothetical protein